MTIREFLDQWPEMPEACLQKYAPAFLALLTPVSKNELYTAAGAYMQQPTERSFRGLQKCYADTARKCMEIEASNLGTIVRARFGRDPITLDTILPEN